MRRYITGAIIGLLIGMLILAFVTDSGSRRLENGQGQSVNQEQYMNKQPLKEDFMTIAPGVSLVPIAHASAVLRWGEHLIFADPVGEAALYTRYGEPDIVFVTHRHPDHFDTDNLPAMLSESTTLIAPQDVVDQLPEGIVAKVVAFAPGETLSFGDLTLTALPAYNLRPEAQQYHPQERGDIGIVFDDGNSRVYFSGDTEGIPEMLALTDIDVAFVAMNLPYTMDVDAAAEAVLTFAPKTVYPYHFRTPDGFSDVERFKQTVEGANQAITVTLLDWYQAGE